MTDTDEDRTLPGRRVNYRRGGASARLLSKGHCWLCSRTGDQEGALGSRGVSLSGAEEDLLIKTGRLSDTRSLCKDS